MNKRGSLTFFKFNRLNLLPVWAVKQWTWIMRIINYRKWHSPQDTRPCPQSLSSWDGAKRHVEILKILQRAVLEAWVKSSLNKKKPEWNQQGLVVLNREEKRVIIIDVTKLFGGHLDDLKEAREAKIDKYSNLTTWLCTLCSIVC